MSKQNSNSLNSAVLTKNVVGDQQIGNDHLSNEPLPFVDKLRNPLIPADHFPNIDLNSIDDATSRQKLQLVNDIREEQLRSNKSSFLEMARDRPEELYQLLFNKKVELNTYNYEIANKNRSYLAQVFNLSGEKVFGSSEPKGIGEMWWGETYVALPSRLGMHGLFTDSGLLLFGNLSWNGAKLYQTSYHIFSSFFLDVKRMPNANRVRSSPGGVLTGSMLGFTFGAASWFMGGFAQGDRWCKCRLRLHQKAYALNPNNPSDIIPAAPSTTAEFQIIDIIRANDFQENMLPGGLAYAPMDIHLIKNKTLRIDLHLEFNISLEGEAEIRFGGIGHSNPAFHQPMQWTLQPF